MISRTGQGAAKYCKARVKNLSKNCNNDFQHENFYLGPARLSAVAAAVELQQSRNWKETESILLCFFILKATGEFTLQ